MEGTSIMKNRFDNRDVRDDPRYHNTWQLLRKYRDVIWSMELSVIQLKQHFHADFGCDVDEFLDSLYSAGADLSGTEIEAHARCIERSRKMLKLLQGAFSLLREKHKNGEELYWILYYTYLSPQKLDNLDEILEQLQPHIHDISYRTYYRRRKEAVYTLSTILWGYTTRDNLQLLDELFPAEDGGTKVAGKWQ